jgi:UDP:flavonoid glycosyltransferase YjiC (YdhE family)
MHITILALGSRGDVQPYAALGRGLREAGHQVRFITFEGFASLIASNGLAFHPIQGNAQALVAQAGANTLALVRSFRSLAEGYARDLSSPHLGETDLLINQLPAGLYGVDLAEKYRIPMVLAGVFPLTRTREIPLMGFPKLPFPAYNKFTYFLGGSLAWQMFRSVINRWRTQTLKLTPHPWQGYLEQLETRRIPVLNGYSQHVVPRPSDWQEYVHVTGYWFPEDRDWQPSEELRSFLDAGDPPVFLGFGSMPIKDPEGATQILLEALRQSGQRAILHMGWGGLGTRALPKSVFRMDYAPYEWLFPRMSMIVHHGGSGTTGFALRAGVPSLVVPFVFDQFYWAKRTVQLGVGPQPIPFKNLSVSRLREAIEAGVNDSEMKHKAFQLGQKIQAENGIARAVRVIETIIPAH